MILRRFIIFAVIAFVCYCPAMAEIPNALKQDHNEFKQEIAKVSQNIAKKTNILELRKNLLNNTILPTNQGTERLSPGGAKEVLSMIIVAARNVSSGYSEKQTPQYLRQKLIYEDLSDISTPRMRHFLIGASAAELSVMAKNAWSQQNLFDALTRKYEFLEGHAKALTNFCNSFFKDRMFQTFQSAYNDVIQQPIVHQRQFAQPSYVRFQNTTDTNQAKILCTHIINDLSKDGLLTTKGTKGNGNTLGKIISEARVYAFNHTTHDGKSVREDERFGNKHRLLDCYEKLVTIRSLEKRFGFSCAINKKNVIYFQAPYDPKKGKKNFLDFNLEVALNNLEGLDFARLSREVYGPNYQAIPFTRSFFPSTPLAKVMVNTRTENRSIPKSTVYFNSTDPRLKPKHQPRFKGRAKISVVNMDTLECGHQLGNDTTLINLANNTYPGGTPQSMGGAQEEKLVQRTDGYAQLAKLQQEGHYPIPELGIIASPSVGTYGLDTNALSSSSFGNFGMIANGAYRYFLHPRCDTPRVYQSPIININKGTNSNTKQQILNAYNEAQNLYLAGTREKIRMQILSAIQMGKKNLVLGAFGCGVFKNPPKAIANLYASVLKEYEGYFENVIFAILTLKEDDKKLFNVFQETFKDGYNGLTVSNVIALSIPFQGCGLFNFVKGKTAPFPTLEELRKIRTDLK